jgi:hypothetical protein
MAIPHIRTAPAPENDSARQAIAARQAFIILTAGCLLAAVLMVCSAFWPATSRSAFVAFMLFAVSLLCVPTIMRWTHGLRAEPGAARPLRVAVFVSIWKIIWYMAGHASPQMAAARQQGTDMAVVGTLVGCAGVVLAFIRFRSGRAWQELFGVSVGFLALTAVCVHDRRTPYDPTAPDIFVRFGLAGLILVTHVVLMHELRLWPVRQ